MNKWMKYINVILLQWFFIRWNDFKFVSKEPIFWKITKVKVTI